MVAKRLFFIIMIIGILMALNVYLINQNGKRITRNQQIIKEAEEVKIAAEEILQTLHLLDVGVRAYALLGNKEMYLSPADTARTRKDRVFKFLQNKLSKQNYPLDELSVLQDTVNFYFNFISDVASTIKSGNFEQAKAMIEKDHGYFVWQIAKQHSLKVAAYENSIAEKANAGFKKAINNSFWLQVILFLIAMPTLIYATVFTNKSLNLLSELKKVETDKASILENQKETLERLVRERTDEILAQNEEIRAQNEEISTQNDRILLQNQEMSDKQQLIEEKNKALQMHNNELDKAKLLIEKQQKQLEMRNHELSKEIVSQNEALKQTNLELVHQINKLEQFGYIISHNLRAPTARLLGLGSLIENVSGSEREKVIQLMIKSSRELHEVIDDMGRVLLVQKPGSKILENVKLAECFEKVKTVLADEIEHTQAEIITDFSALPELTTLPLYIESILYNLISNAIKYHKKNIPPQVQVYSSQNEEFNLLKVKDNGMGLDLERDGDKIFGLYKRFHLHVEGKGLGLYLVKAQVEALGGSIYINSELGKYTEFTIAFKR